jgi:phage/conjugal plasmid C-4 type zinc finger TraR family protein
MDQFDRAQELDARYLQQALEQHKERTRLMDRESLTHCLECGDKIPAARQAILPGVKLCVTCAQQLERNGRR